MSDTSVVRINAAACPECGSLRLHRYRTNPRGTDGSVLRYVQCLDCYRKFRLVTIPPAGNVADVKR